MKTLKFNNNDTFPCIGLGTWKAQGKELKNAIVEAINAGYRHIDTASIYDNEEEIGEALAEIFKLGEFNREQLFITSKLWNDAHDEDSVMPALKDSLTKLGLDYLDLYLVHWPVAFTKGVVFPSKPSEYIPLNKLPIIETWKQMELANKTGLTRHIGVSNFSVKKLKDLISKANIIPEVNQVELHPLLQQNDLYDYCKIHGVVLTAYSPLGSGDRSEGMKAENEPSLMELPVIKNIAVKHGVSPAQILIAWHCKRETAVIPKSTNVEHMISNLNSHRVPLDNADLEQISALEENYRFINGKFFEMPGSGYSNIYDE